MVYLYGDNTQNIACAMAFTDRATLVFNLVEVLAISVLINFFIHSLRDQTYGPENCPEYLVY